MRWWLPLILIATLTGCGALGDDNTLPTDGPIPNPAIEAGATQAQGTGGGGRAGVVAENETLQIRIDDQLVDIDDADEYLDGTETLVPEVPNCVDVLRRSPGTAIQRCSYEPLKSPVIVDTVSPSACADGRLLLTLNRRSGEGAHVGIDGERWFELVGSDYSEAQIAQICQG